MAAVKLICESLISKRSLSTYNHLLITHECINHSFLINCLAFYDRRAVNLHGT